LGLRWIANCVVSYQSIFFIYFFMFMELIYIILIVVGLVLIFFVLSYNRLVKLKNNIHNAFADIDVQMKLRFDLIENLVNTVKWYATHEKDTLNWLTEARTKFLSSNTAQDKLNADNMLSGALKSLFAVSENYPDLKANQNFLQVQTELSDIENKIAATRRFFNSSINEYNSLVESFPTNLIASVFWFTIKDSFAVTNEREKEVPKVQF